MYYHVKVTDDLLLNMLTGDYCQDGVLTHKNGLPANCILYDVKRGYGFVELIFKDSIAKVDEGGDEEHKNICPLIGKYYSLKCTKCGEDILISKAIKEVI